MPLPTLPDMLDVRDPWTSVEVDRSPRDGGIVPRENADSREAPVGLAGEPMATRADPDGDRDGVSVIRDFGAGARPVGDARSSGIGQLPHRAGRSQLPYPPCLMLLLSATPATSGGRCRLVNERAVSAESAERSPGAAHALHAAPVAPVAPVAFSGRGDGNLGAVWVRVEPGHQATRLRRDEPAPLSPAARHHLHLPREITEANTPAVETGSGHGCAIDDHRWSHARGAFAGGCTMPRVLGDARPRFAPAAGSIVGVVAGGDLEAVAG